jgi:hypothetical protein
MINRYYIQGKAESELAQIQRIKPTGIKVEEHQL